MLTYVDMMLHDNTDFHTNVHMFPQKVSSNRNPAMIPDSQTQWGILGVVATTLVTDGSY